ncbi:lipocalin family protein [Mucilaginibacter sp. KACC 22063]|uniref:lipocalin family protein n=1 Tax=Mucilaginibacter sp. KACC 22063 TaxID=3025666 RepID=UPI00236523CF|nr:lipocalin family protein [Mucilaginibacter sp. KACC 22063]WDF54495.1 lipocalin family protein [Mucilaginibacter sp. KACC 22063]
MRNMLIVAFAILMFSACTGALSQEQLVGKWNYVKVGVPNSSPPDTVTRAELEENKPYIVFKQDNTFSITWGGKTLSHGTYQLSGKNINVKEALPDGKTRDFPFYVSEISGKKITFETTGADGSRVTAVKE